MAQFQKGQSGNPGGRPKGLSEYVRQTCGEKGEKLVAILWAIATNAEADNRDRIKATEALLDRGWNKPTQGVTFAEAPAPMIIDRVTPDDIAASRAARED